MLIRPLAMLLMNTKVQQACKNLKIQVSKLDPPTEIRLYTGALIPKDKTTVNQTPLQINTKIREKNLFILMKKNIRQGFIYIIQIYSYHSLIISMPPPFPILNQTNIMTTIHISTMINNSSKIKFSSTKYLILYFSNHLNGR